MQVLTQYTGLRQALGAGWGAGAVVSEHQKVLGTFLGGEARGGLAVGLQVAQSRFYPEAPM